MIGGGVRGRAARTSDVEHNCVTRRDKCKQCSYLSRGVGVLTQKIHPHTLNKKQQKRHQRPGDPRIFGSVYFKYMFMSMSC